MLRRASLRYASCILIALLAAVVPGHAREALVRREAEAAAAAVAAAAACDYATGSWRRIKDAAHHPPITYNSKEIGWPKADRGSVLLSLRRLLTGDAEQRLLAEQVATLLKDLPNQTSTGPSFLQLSRLDAATRPPRRAWQRPRPRRPKRHHRRLPRAAWRPAAALADAAGVGAAAPAAAEAAALREAVMWRWAPQAPPGLGLGEGCPLASMTHASFCDAMARHSLSRVVFVGDIPMMQMAKSFRGLVASTQCPQGNIELWSTRNDQLSKGSSASCTLCDGRECGSWCEPWWRRYLESERPTLLVVGMGSGVPSVAHFQRFTTRLVSGINGDADALPRRRLDRVVFRLGTPGHEGCKNFKRPLANLAAFDDANPLALSGELARAKSWHLIPACNDHVRRLVRSSRPGGPHFSLLDVFELTLLRPDAHEADCSRYELPGVPDWWNHLLLTELARAAPAPAPQPTPVAAV